MFVKTIDYNRVHTFFMIMQKNEQYSDSLKELREYAFVTYIREMMTTRLMRVLFSNYRLFVPTTISLPLYMRRKDICNHGFFKIMCRQPSC